MNRKMEVVFFGGPCRAQYRGPGGDTHTLVWEHEGICDSIQQACTVRSEVVLADQGIVLR